LPSKYEKELWKRIGHEEPSFTLAPWDVLAIPVLAYWIRLARAANVDVIKVKDAERILQDMLSYAEENPDKMKVPD
jgi:hypothetical protein